MLTPEAWWCTRSPARWPALPTRRQPDPPEEATPLVNDEDQHDDDQHYDDQHDDDQNDDDQNDDDQNSDEYEWVFFTTITLCLLEAGVQLCLLEVGAQVGASQTRARQVQPIVLQG